MEFSEESLKELPIEELVKKFIYYLDVVEESDNGREFHPNHISSCRVLDARDMRAILVEMRNRTQ